jgi:hypothetical protein
MKRLLGGVMAVTAALGLANGGRAAEYQNETGGRIAWFGTWKEGVAEAKRSHRPILLIAAAPHCHNVSGIW